MSVAATRPLTPGPGLLVSEAGMMVSRWRFIFSWFNLMEERERENACVPKPSEHPM